MVEDYGEALQPYAKKLEKAYRKIEKRHVKGEFPPGTEIPEEIKVCPPPKGYVKMNYSDNPWVEDPVSVIYRPREPVNPLLWFNIRGNANIQRGPKEDEKLMCDYVLLAVIHDYMLRQSTDRPIFCEKYDGKWFKRDQFRQEVGQHYLPNEATLYCKGRTTQERAEYCQNLLSGLKRAFNHVQADIKKARGGEKPAETRQEKDGQPTTLRSFIEIHCDLTAKPDVQSKVTLLHEYNRKKKIELPKLARKHRKGQHKYYYVDDLKKNWATYQQEMPTLPPLRVPGK